jgi:hypothetical protein
MSTRSSKQINTKSTVKKVVTLDYVWKSLISIQASI